MRHYILVGALIASSLLAGEKTVPLVRDFEKAKELSILYETPMVLLFTGSDWSQESQKLLNLIQTNDFIEAIGNHFLFVEADFPETNVQKAEIIKENFALKEKFQVEEFPTIIFLDREGIELKRIGFVETGAKEFAQHLKSMGIVCERLRNRIQGLDYKSVADEWLEKLYIETLHAGMSQDAQKLLDGAIAEGRGLALLVEAYSRMISAGLKETLEFQKVRSVIDQANFIGKSDLKMRLALIDYQEEVKQDPEVAKEHLRKTFEKLRGYKDLTIQLEDFIN